MAKEYLRRNLIQAGSYGLLAQIDTIEKRASNNKQTPKWLLQAIYELQKRANAIPQELTLWRDSAPDNPYLTKVKP